MEQDGIRSSAENDDNMQKDSFSKRRFGKYFLLLVFAISMIACLYVIRIFVIDIILAVMLATLFHPLFKSFLKILWNKRGVSAFLTCTVILLGVLIPLFFLSNVFIMQAIYLYHSGLPHLKHIIDKDIALFYRIKDSYIGTLLETYGIDWQEAVTNGMNLVGANIAKFINITSKTTLRLVLDLFVTLFSTFYFLKDGQIILGNIKDSIPLNDEHKNNIIHSFSMILNATVKGVLYVALLQSFLGTMTLWFFGVKAWLLLGGIMLVLAAIPFVGTGGVLVPVGIIRIVNGQVGSGITIIVLSVLFISLIDNFIRPRIVGHYASIHDLLIFFGIIGGISVFGPAGLIIGPVIIAIFVTILEIYNVEFYEHIKYSKNYIKDKKICEDQPDLKK